MSRILLMGYFGAGNFGDDALLVDWLGRRRPWLEQHGLSVDVITNGGSLLGGFIEGEALQPLVSAEIPKRDALKVNPRDYSALIAPGGSLLQDATSIRSLLYYLQLLRRFHAAKVPTYMLNQGIGPLTSWTARFFTPRVLARCRLLSLRDRVSHNMCLRSPFLSNMRGLVLAADPIVRAKFEAPSADPSYEFAGKPYALVIPRPTGDLPTPSDPITESAALSVLLSHCAEVTDLELVLLPVNPGQDTGFAQETASVLDHEATVVQLRADSPHNCSRIWSLVSKAALVISYRLHGLVAAAACGIPAMGVAYDPKISSFCNEAGLPYCFPATVHEVDSLDDLRRMWNSKNSVMEYLNSQRELMIKRLEDAEAKFDELWG